MPSGADSPGNDYWANDLDAGMSATWRFAGHDGLARLSGPSSLKVRSDQEFSAQLTRVQLDHVALEAFEATTHTAVRGLGQIADFPTPLMTFILLLSGSMRIELDAGEFHLVAGDHLVIDSRDPFAYEAPVRTRVLRAVVGAEHLDAALRERGTTISRPLPRTALTDAFVAFISSVLAETSSKPPIQGEHLIPVIADLMSAVLSEALLIQARRDGPAGLRYRMERYIEEHYADPELDPTSVSAAFGISLAHAHHVFNDDERTLAHVIRDRRVAAVALELRAEPGTIRFDLLAARYGFSSRDSLARAFQQRFGMTLTAYRDGGHRHFG